MGDFGVSSLPNNALKIKTNTQTHIDHDLTHAGTLRHLGYVLACIYSTFLSWDARVCCSSHSSGAVMKLTTRIRFSICKGISGCFSKNILHSIRCRGSIRSNGKFQLFTTHTVLLNSSPNKWAARRPFIRFPAPCPANLSPSKMRKRCSSKRSSICCCDRFSRISFGASANNSRWRVETWLCLPINSSS